MIKDKLKTLPMKPGCYLMKDKEGEVIYVGKAIKLKNRVNSYFRGAHDYKTTKLVSNINDFDYIVTKNEKEALILEYNLIKKYNPYFNIQFKDDKSYPYILLQDKEIPYLTIKRLNGKTKIKNGKLFGPYPNVTSARNTINLLNRLYPIRKCNNLKNDLCLYFHIGECLGYCKNNINKRIVDNYIQNITNFLNGNTNEIIKNLKAKMIESSNNLEFEKSAKYRDLIDDINKSTIKQTVQLNSNENFDVFNYDVLDGYICVIGLFIRKGKLINSIKHINYLIGDNENYVSRYIYEFYNENIKSKYLVVSNELLDYLYNFDDEIKVESPNRGKKYQLLKQAKLNANEYLKQNEKIAKEKTSYLDNIKDEFKRIFNKEINHIEIFDNSHTSGKETVGAMVVYKNYKTSKKDYRLFKLDDSSDDLKSMYEMLYRRYFKVLKENLNKPDLIIVDGGKTQIEVANKVINELNLNINICGLGKNDKHNTSYLMNNNYEIIKIDPKSNIFFFLTNMQDEVHRFAITYHKARRKKSVYNSVLDNIDGLGPKTKLKLLREYKSISNIKKASIEDLGKHINNNLAIKLYNKIRENNA